ncbi:hypothetical protein BGZ74_006436, partial [Mortierella antarctica]
PIMSTTSSHSSGNKLGLKSFLKIAAGLALLGQASVANACVESWISIYWNTVTKEVCRPKVGCYDVDSYHGKVEINVPGHIQEHFTFTDKDHSDINFGKRCDPKGNYCINFGNRNEVTVHYANAEFTPRLYNQGGDDNNGSAHYTFCPF